jgi:hypothetical protein
MQRSRSEGGKVGYRANAGFATRAKSWVSVFSLHEGCRHYVQDRGRRRLASVGSVAGAFLIPVCTVLAAAWAVHPFRWAVAALRLVQAVILEPDSKKIDGPKCPGQPPGATLSHRESLKAAIDLLKPDLVKC